MPKVAVDIIAEVASNHGGSMTLAKEFIWRFAEAGADFVKFQHTRVRHLRPDDPQFAWFQQAELSLDQFAELKTECEKAGTQFLTTIYHPDDLYEVASFGISAIKIGSGEAGDSALADAVTAGSWPRIFVSLGLLDNIVHLSPLARRRVRHEPRAEFLGCVTRYPAPIGIAATVCHRERIAGWSDHAVGLNECQAALAMGARVIEKHVKLDHQARAPQPWEASVEEIAALRRFADDDPAAKYRGRWQFASTTSAD